MQIVSLLLSIVLMTLAVFNLIRLKQLNKARRELKELEDMNKILNGFYKGAYDTNIMYMRIMLKETVAMKKLLFIDDEISFEKFKETREEVKELIKSINEEWFKEYGL